MKVLIDGHMLGKNEGGNERYIKNLTFNLMELDKLELKVLVSKSYFQKIKEGKELRTCFLRQKNNSDILRLLYYLPKTAQSFQADIIHSTYISPFFKKAKFVVTVHDFSFKYYPEFYTPKEKLIFEYLLPISLKRADAIIVPSNFCKKEAMKYFPDVKKKVFVTYEAADKVFRAIDKRLAKNLIYKKFKLDGPFLLTLNSKNPKKNIQRIIEAFLAIADKFPTLKLIIIGGNFNIKNYKKLAKRVIVLENISDKDLNLFYNACKIFIYFSLYEGFGLPIIEALKCKAPVIASDIEVHKEISKKSIIYASPFEPKNLSAQIKVLLSYNSVKQNLISTGYRVAKSYSWKQTAKQTLEIYNSLY